MILSILLWILFSILIAIWGKSKSIGFAGALIICLLLSPLVGLIVVAVSSPARSNKPSPAQVYFDAGERYAFKGQYAEAIDKYKDALFEISRENDRGNKNLVERKRKRTAKVTAKIQEAEEKMKG